MDDFIEKDNEIDGSYQLVKEELQKLKKQLGAKDYYSDDGSSDMEARYDDIQYEEKMAERIARKEDAEQLRLI